MGKYVNSKGYPSFYNDVEYIGFKDSEIINYLTSGDLEKIAYGLYYSPLDFAKGCRIDLVGYVDTKIIVKYNNRIYYYNMEERKLERC